MKEIKFKGHTITIHDDIKEMSIDRFSSFNKNALLDSDIGGDIHAIDKRFSKMYEFLNEGLVDDAKKEALNLRKTFFFTLNEINPENFSFACLVYQIDKETFSTFTNDALTGIINKLKSIGLTKRVVEESISEVKKN